MTAKKTQRTGAKTGSKHKPKLAVFEAGAGPLKTSRKEQAADEASAEKLARLEAPGTIPAKPGSDEALEGAADAPRATTAAPEAKKPKAAKPERLSALDAAAKVLQEEAGEPMNARSLIEAMASKGLWTSPGGKTPHATLFAAITREITVKGKESRFQKSLKGHFTAM